MKWISSLLILTCLTACDHFKSVTFYYEISTCDKSMLLPIVTFAHVIT